MSTQAKRSKRFLELHQGAEPLLLPNPWDAGSAKVLATLGFSALATTSAGYAGTLGRTDGRVTRDEAIEHASVIVGATDLPVSADLEDAFAREPAGVAQTITLAIEAGLAGGSVEDFTRDHADPIFDIGLAVERVSAAAEVAHGGANGFVLTARTEGYLHGQRDLGTIITRLQAFQAAGADVLYAPGVADAEELRTLVREVDLPVNVLALPGAPSVSELGAIGVKRVSVGSGFSNVAFGALVEAGREWLEQGTYGFWSTGVFGMGITGQAFS